MPDLLLDQEDAGRLLRHYIDSRDYWVLVFHTRAGARAAWAVEEKFYQQHPDDFSLLLVPQPGCVVGIGFAHKRRASAFDLADALARHGVAVTVHDLEARDVLVLGGNELVAMWIHEQYTRASEDGPDGGAVRGS
jgi:hypothetical protein